MQSLKLTAMALCACLLVSTLSIGQQNIRDRVNSQKQKFENLQSKKPLEKPGRTPILPEVRNLKNPVVLTLNQGIVNELKGNSDNVLKLEIPSKEKPMVLNLVKARIFDQDFKVKQSSNPRADVNIDFGDHYWGTIEGEGYSFVSISIFKDQMSGIINVAGKTLNIGKLNNNGYHVVHEESEEEPSPLGCHVEKSKHYFGDQIEIKELKSQNGNNCVSIYVETAYDMYQSLGSVDNVVNFVTGVFSQVSALYANENINLKISQLWIWNTNDPYTAADPGEYLDSFKAQLAGSNSHNPAWNGNLAHLLSFDVLGGVAYVNVMCNRNYGFGFSGLSRSYSQLPAYSWTVEVITHELGHNLGSPHTHDCSWNGNNTAIDGCGTAAGYGTGCDAPLPSSGTIMSYCHLTNVGIDFSLGFGQQPGDLIRTRVQYASCASSSCNTCEDTGLACDDNDPCTINDTIDENCNCAGTLADADGDGVCDSNDKCPGSDDTIDMNGNGVPDGCESCLDQGITCNDNDPCTVNDRLDENCNCVGTYTDNDADGICQGSDPNDNDPCIPNTCNSCPVVDENSFDSGFGRWRDGGSDAQVVTTYAYSGAYSLRIRDNSNSSIATSPTLDLSAASEIQVSFTYIAQSMETNEDFWLQVSTDNGQSFKTVRDYNSGTEFRNDTREFVDTSIPGPFTSQTKLRFRCDASTNSDFIYIDDFKLTACDTGTGISCDDGIQNGDETGVDCGGTSCTPCPATCDDGIQNGNETSVDCGGSTCAPCPASCDDGIQNGDETGVDCGGANCAPCTNSGCTEISNDNFESGWGIWNDGGSDASRSSQSNYANSGIYSLLIRDNSSTSIVYTDNIDLNNYTNVNFSFSYIARSMDNSSEDFWLEMSTNGGSSFTRIEEWNLNDEFQNNQRKNESLAITGPFSANTVFRFKCDASSNNDFIYLDDIRIEACAGAPSLVSNTDISSIKASTNIGTRNDVKELSFQIYPNPVDNFENIKVKIQSPDDNSTVSIVNINGEIMSSIKLGRNEYNQKELSTSRLTAGTYFVYIQSNNELAVEKLIILR